MRDPKPCGNCLRPLGEHELRCPDPFSTVWNGVSECPGLTLFQRQACQADMQHCPGCSAAARLRALVAQQREALVAIVNECTKGVGEITWPPGVALIAKARAVLAQEVPGA